MKTIKMKILMPVVLLVTISLVLVGGIACFLTFQSAYSTLELTMKQAAAIASARVEQQLKTVTNVAAETGCIARITSTTSSLENKKEIIDEKIKAYQFIGGGAIDSTGKDIFTGTNYGSQEFFKTAMGGNVYVSAPMEIAGYSDLVILFAAPLWDAGLRDTSIQGAIYYLYPYTYLSDIVGEVKISAGGTAYMIDNGGVTIAHTNPEGARNRENTANDAKSNPKLSALAAIEGRMAAGQHGFESYSYGGVNKFLAYSPVSGGNGWSIAVCAPIRDFLEQTYIGIFVVVIMLIVFVIIGSILSSIIASKISKPVKELERSSKLLSSGDFSIKVTHTSDDELGALSDSMRGLCNTVIGVIRDVEHVLGGMGSGNFTIPTASEDVYMGDFVKVKHSMEDIRKSLSNTITQINISSNEVSSGSEQVASGAQALSQGTTEQASSIEELSATIAEMTSQITGNADNAQRARVQTEKADNEVQYSNKRMSEMSTAMDRISAKSTQISKIIKTIEDIAFQTNILALNAAVEAARAGVSGKGFAVVADEVRSLAGKSAEAAKNTTVLIGETVLAVNDGSKIAEDTAQTMIRVVEATSEVAAIVNNIADATVLQSNAAAQINIGIDQISAVIQTNSATAEESAAASEELSSQAVTLKEMISRFTLPEQR